MARRAGHRGQADESATDGSGLARVLPGSGFRKILLAGLLLFLAVPGGRFLLTAWRDAGLAARLPPAPESRPAGSVLDDLIRKTDAAARASPDSPAAIGSLALVYHANHFYEEARTAYDLVVALEPTNPDWLYYRVLLEEEAGGFQRLRPLLEKALQIDPEHSAAKTKLGEVMIKQGRSQEAAQLFREVLQNDASQVQAALGLARVASNVQEWQLVERTLEPMLQSHPSIRQPHQVLEKAYRETGEPARAREQERILQKRDLTTFLPTLDPFRKRIDSWCRLSTPLLKLVYRAEYAGEFEAMLRFARRAVESDPEDPDALHFLARALAWARGNDASTMREVQASVGQALRLRPRYVDHLLLLSEALLTVGAFDLSEDYCRQFLQVRPEVEKAHNVLGRALMEQGRVQEAVSSYSEALRLEPHRAETHNNLCLALFSLGRLEEASDHCRAALGLDPTLVAAHNHLGLVLAGRGKMKEAVSHYQAALELDPRYAEARNNLGLALASQGRMKEARRTFEEAIRARPAYAEAHNNLALALLRLGERDLAVSHLEQALKLDPDYVDAHRNLALVCVQNGESMKAVRHLTEVARLRPDSAQVHHDLGTLLCLAGQPAQGVEHLSRALQLQPDLAEAREGLRKCRGAGLR